MNGVIDAFWRATAYCLHPRVILLSLLPVALTATGVFVLGYFFWEAAIDGVRAALDQSLLLAPLVAWLDGLTGGTFRVVLGPVVVLALALPLIVIASLLIVAVLMGPAMVKLVAARRFPALQKRAGTPWWLAALWAVGATLLAVLLLVLSLPLWLIPPVALILPPVIWGWLTYRVMTVDALADHADADERLAVMRQHRWRLFGMGIVTGYLSAAPSLVWVFSGPIILAMAPVLVPIFMWLYTLVFAFSALWFTHYCLAALNRHRALARPHDPVPEGTVTADGVEVLPAAPATTPPPPLLPPPANPSTS